ncbi:hypothetical protein C8F04DRAFT_47313 [Mycena alexandri]|uniref:Uncharacterized protein n=1 Tax=Mycena alexandri TaxID=1745969 RepID=A0AAD6SMF3_9AGAR|nr:hypothetical protein C8F04DRAFT_47313 [Mycena alexandri]
MSITPPAPANASHYISTCDAGFSLLPDCVHVHTSSLGKKHRSHALQGAQDWKRFDRSRCSSLHSEQGCEILRGKTELLLCYFSSSSHVKLSGFYPLLKIARMPWHGNRTTDTHSKIVLGFLLCALPSDACLEYWVVKRNQLLIAARDCSARPTELTYNL